MRNPCDRYTYLITWSAEDAEHVALCAEFNNETPPEPLAERTYSGRFVVRVPPETHRELALKAAEEGVSLNRLVSARLAR